MTYLTTPMSVSVHRAGVSPVYGEGGTLVTVQDDGGGPYLEIRQEGMDEPLTIDLDELREVYSAAARLIRIHEKLGAEK